jgi:spore coat polysaccharide biosynthesis protein SpsF
MGSSRLPGKALVEIIGRPAIWHLFQQLRNARRVQDFILATTSNPADDPLATYATGQSWRVFRGSEQDVLDRYYQAAVQAGCTGSDVIVRVTGDDILADPEIVDRVVDLMLADCGGVTHASNNRTARFPYGADVEAFTFAALEQAWREAELPREREHVTPYIRNHPEQFPYAEMTSPEDLSHIRLSIDYPEDLEFNRALFKRLYQEMQPPFHLRDVIRCIEKYDVRHPARTGR